MNVLSMPNVLFVFEIVLWMFMCCIYCNCFILLYVLYVFVLCVETMSHMCHMFCIFPLYFSIFIDSVIIFRKSLAKHVSRRHKMSFAQYKNDHGDWNPIQDKYYR